MKSPKVLDKGVNDLWDQICGLARKALDLPDDTENSELAERCMIYLNSSMVYPIRYCEKDRVYFYDTTKFNGLWAASPGDSAISAVASRTDVRGFETILDSGGMDELNSALGLTGY